MVNSEIALACSGDLRHTERACQTKRRPGFAARADIGGRTAALWRYFYVRLPRLLWAAVAGVPSGTPVSYVTGLQTPSFAAHPILQWGAV